MNFPAIHSHPGNRARVIISLCDLSGNWPRFYREAGYTVRTFDLKNGDDVRLLVKPQERIHGILAAPPCTVFANSGARWPRTQSEMVEALSVVDACLRLVLVCKPAWWSLENPVGKLSRYLGPPVMYFDPCDYGDAYTKRTALWGNFTPPPVAVYSRRSFCRAGASEFSRLVDSKARRQVRAHKSIAQHYSSRVRACVLRG